MLGIPLNRNHNPSNSHHFREAVSGALRDRATKLIIDVANQFSKAAIFSLVCKLPEIDQAVLAGDSAQLTSFSKSIPVEVWTHAQNSILHLPAGCAYPIRLTLSVNYRSVKILSDAVSYAGYDGDLLHAASFPRTLAPKWDSKVPFPLPSRNVPICLVDIRGDHSFAQTGTSRNNAQELDAVVETVQALRASFGHTMSIAVLSLYGDQVTKLQQPLKGTALKLMFGFSTPPPRFGLCAVVRLARIHARRAGVIPRTEARPKCTKCPLGLEGL